MFVKTNALKYVHARRVLRHIKFAVLLKWRDLERLMLGAFLQAQHDLTTKYNELPLDSKLSGTTVTMVVYLRNQHRLVVAHVGNSRAVLCRLGERGAYMGKLPQPYVRAAVCASNFKKCHYFDFDLFQVARPVQ